MAYESFLNFTGGLANIATVVAIVVGGIWVWRRFRVSGEPYARAGLEHLVLGCDVSSDKLLLRLWLTIKNVGAVRLNVADLFVRIQQIAPCEGDAVREFETADKFMLEGRWPKIGEKTITNAKCAIEAGETEVFEFDFLIPKMVESFAVYSHVSNSANPGRGWNCSTWHKCKELLQ